MFMYWPGSSTRSLGRLGYASPAVPNTKPYQYRVPAGGGLVRMIQAFGLTDGSDTRTQALDVNPGGTLQTCTPPTGSSYICLFIGGREVQPGDLLNVPANWPDPTDTTNLVCIGGSGSPPDCGVTVGCPAGQYPSDGQGGACLPPPFPVPNPPGTCPSGLFKDVTPNGPMCVASCPPGKKPDANGNCVSAVTTAGVSGGGAAFAVILAVAAAVLALGSEQKTGRGARRTRGMGASIR